MAVRFVVSSQAGWQQKRGFFLHTSEEFAEAKSRKIFHNAAVALARLYLANVNDFLMGEMR